MLDELASARGELLGGQPAGAPLALVSQLGDRLTGILACATIAIGFEWWLGLGLLAVWFGVRRPLADGMRVQARRVRSAAEPMRRSWYMLGLAWKPPAAKEVRMFGLGDWIADRHREEWLEGIRPAWDGVRQLTRTAWITGGVVLVAYTLVAGWLGWTAYHHEISLQTLATMLPMLPASMAAGSISYADISLEQLLSALPDLDSLTSRLARGGALTAGGSPAAGLPQEVVSFEQVSFTYPNSAAPVLTGLELELRVGKSLGLVGVNGAGKTTLVTLLARMREPTAGRITVDGRPLDELNAREWQQQVAVVYQDFARLPLTAAENIGMFGQASPIRRGWIVPPSSPGQPTSSPRSPEGGKPSCRRNTRVASTCRAGSGSASRWPGPCTRSAAARVCWCSTSPPHSSTSAARPPSTSASSS